MYNYICIQYMKKRAVFFPENTMEPSNWYLKRTSGIVAHYEDQKTCPCVGSELRGPKPEKCTNFLPCKLNIPPKIPKQKDLKQQ